VNASGKTVKSPLDGILFVAGANPPHMVAVHHTTAKQSDLENKWLHDPATVKPRSGGKPTAPPGDIVKTISEFRKAQAAMPGLRGTLVLTTNQEPTTELVQAVNAAANAAGLTVEIWSRSVLAHFLDVNPDGQWLRRKFLRIEQERISCKLLCELSKRSLELNHPSGDSAAWIDRALDATLSQHQGQSVLFVVGESGVGKSVACFKRLARHVDAGGFGLVLTHDVVANSLSLDQAIDSALRQLHPALAPNAGSETRALASEHTPLLLGVEDINKSGQAVAVLERLTTWGASRNSASDSASTQILAPVWPRIIAQLNDEARKRIAALSIETIGFSASEGTTAVERRRQSAGVSTTRLEAEAVSAALGHDPLLIALHDPAASQNADDVIGAYVRSSFQRLSAIRKEFTAAEYATALRSLASAMLSQSTFAPTMSDVRTWLGESAASMVRHIVHFAAIARLVGLDANEHIVFRHDRVRDWLLADAVSASIAADDLDEAILGEPFYAEILAFGLLRSGQFPALASRLGTVNPLTLFHALQGTAPGTTDHDAAIQAAKAWLTEPSNLRESNAHLRWEALRALARTDSPAVNDLVPLFNAPNSIWGLQARFRNGDVGAGITLCCQTEPGTRIIGRRQLFEYVQQRYGKNLIDALNKLLLDRQLPQAARVGALRLTGHLGNPAFADALEDSWMNDQDRDSHLVDYLWAAAECCGDDPARLLGPVCDAWAALPNTRADKGLPSPRERLASDSVRWAFEDRLPNPAIRYFIERAGTEELKWPITYMLHNIDEPDAIDFLARELADTEKRLEGTNRFSTFVASAQSDWSRRQERSGRPMSPASKTRLLGLWSDKSQSIYLRRQAFRLWSATLADDDLPILRKVDESDELWNSVLWARLRRGDRQAIPNLIVKLQSTDNNHWWQLARHIWADELTAALDDDMTKRGLTVVHDWGAKGGDADCFTYEAIMRLPPVDAEALLLRHWDHLQYSSYFIQAALYAATPRLLAAVADVVPRCPEAKALFQYISMHFGFNTVGHPGVTRRSQIEGLVPYADYFDDMTIHDIAQSCNEHGWFDLRRAHFDSYMKPADGNHFNRIYFNDAIAMSELDRLAAKDTIHWADLWLDDYLKSGVTLDHVMSVLRSWLAAQTTLTAFKLAAEIVIYGGRRTDLSTLDAYQSGPADVIAAIKADAAFAVRRRSLL
jgi:hypothetical protein